MDADFCTGIHIVIVTGLSGSGKSTVLKAFEDNGYYCVENLPVEILPAFLANIARYKKFSYVALVMDVREEEFLAQHATIFSDINRSTTTLEILFLEAADNVLLRRYSQTRRRHPLAKERGVLEAITLERRYLTPLRETATRIIDTTTLNVHELRGLIFQIYADRETPGQLRIGLISFGFKYGIPLDADMILDARFLPNPFFVPTLKPLIGLDPEVSAFVLEHEETRRFLTLINELFLFLLPQYREEGKAYWTIGVGCTGGRHRSVALIEEFRCFFEKRGETVWVNHRDIERD